MISEETLDLFKYVLRHPKDVIYDFMSFIRKYHECGNVSEGRLLRNLVLSLPESDAAKYKDEIEFLKQCDQDYLAINFFPYPKERTGTSVDCGFDTEVGLPYVVHKGMRLYFCRETNLPDVQKAYLNFIENEGILGTGSLRKSPHSYVTDEFCVEKDDVLIDVGCSEALFALDNIDVAGKIYVFETMKKWKKPLSATFSKFGDKVTIVNKFVGKETKGRTVRLDDVLPNELDVGYFLKMDIEGGEFDVLQASADFLKNHKVKLSCCLYHRQGDEARITCLLRNMGFEVQLSDGYMLPALGGVSYPYFRHGVVHARNY